MLLTNEAISALLNLFLLAGLPFLVYFAYQKWRQKRGFRRSRGGSGLQLGEGRYIGYSLAVALATVAVLVIWPPPLEPFLREGSPQRAFVGLGLSGQAVAMALLYGVVKTGFTEELLFRGLIAGSLARRLPAVWANLCASPHLPRPAPACAPHHARDVVDHPDRFRRRFVRRLGAHQVRLDHRAVADPRIRQCYDVPQRGRPNWSRGYAQTPNRLMSPST